MGKEQRILELEKELKRLRTKQRHWLSCQDGSYECALAMDGYGTLAKELRELKEELKK